MLDTSIIGGRRPETAHKRRAVLKSLTAANSIVLQNETIYKFAVAVLPAASHQGGAEDETQYVMPPELPDFLATYSQNVPLKCQNQYFGRK